MRHIDVTGLVACLTSLSISAGADDWTAYQRLMDRFYRLDRQAVAAISCRVEVREAEVLLKQLRTQFEPMKDKIEMVENLDEFELTYLRESGPEFRRPSLRMKLLSEEGVGDPKQVRKGMEMVETGFEEQIDGIVMQLRGILDQLRTPEQSNYRILEVKGDEREYAARYERSGSTCSETFSGKQRKVREITTTGYEVSSTEEYGKVVDDRLLVTGLRVNMVTPLSNVETDVSIEYRDLGGVWFPTRIKSHTKQSIATTRQEGYGDIGLANCVLRKNQ